MAACLTIDAIGFCEKDPVKESRVSIGRCWERTADDTAGIFSAIELHSSIEVRAARRVNLSRSIGSYRRQAIVFDGKADGKNATNNH